MSLGGRAERASPIMAAVPVVHLQHNRQTVRKQTNPILRQSSTFCSPVATIICCHCTFLQTRGTQRINISTIRVTTCLYDLISLSGDGWVWWWRDRSPHRETTVPDHFNKPATVGTFCHRPLWQQKENFEQPRKRFQPCLW